MQEEIKKIEDIGNRQVRITKVIVNDEIIDSDTLRFSLESIDKKIDELKISQNEEMNKLLNDRLNIQKALAIAVQIGHLQDNQVDYEVREIIEANKSQTNPIEIKSISDEPISEVIIK